jgi:hypothetical protein
MCRAANSTHRATRRSRLTITAEITSQELLRVGTNGGACLLRFHSSEDHHLDRDDPDGGAGGS